MPAMQNMLFLLIFGVCALLGFFLVMRSTRQYRRPRHYKDVLVAWAEPPGTGFREDLPTWIAINLHRGTVILLGLVALWLLLSQPVQSLARPDWPLALQFLLDPLLTGLVGVIGFFWGFIVGGLLAEVTGGDRHYALSETGVLAGGRLWPWELFTHLSMDGERGAIHLWSAPLPGTIAFSFHPPTETRPALLSALQAHVRMHGAPAQKVQRYGFPLRMVFLCAPFVAAGLFLAWMPSAPALMALAALMWLVLALGSRFILRWVYGGQGRPAPVEH